MCGSVAWMRLPSLLCMCRRRSFLRRPTHGCFGWHPTRGLSGHKKALTNWRSRLLRQATGLPVFEFHSMNEVVSGSFEDRRMLMLVMTIFGCLALLLAAIGIYGIIAYTVEQRTHEIGIRVALGAEAAQVRNMVVR